MNVLAGALSDTYSREEAILDGQLVDVSETAAKLGYRCQVAVTATLWHKYIDNPPELFEETKQRRVWDMLWLLRFAILPVNRTSHFNLTPGKPIAVKVTALADPDDYSEAAITIMLPGEN